VKNACIDMVHVFSIVNGKKGFAQIGSPLTCLLACLLLLVSACGSSKKLNKEEDLEKKRLEEIYQKVGERQLRSDWMDARAKIKYEDANMQVGATAYIRVKKDSIIWVSVRKMGFEVARIQIQQDSVFVLDRLNNEYMKKPISAIKDYIELPANFQIIQSLVYGHPVFFSTQRPSVTIIDRNYRLSLNTPEMNSEYLIDEDYLLKSVDLLEVRTGQSFAIRFDDYQIEDGNQNFSYIRLFKMDSPVSGQASLDVKFSKVEFNVPKNISFEIPEKYTRMD
jgi:hypothetical protein